MSCKHILESQEGAETFVDTIFGAEIDSADIPHPRELRAEGICAFAAEIP